MAPSHCSHTEDGEKVYTVDLTEDEFNSLEALGDSATEALRETALMKSVCMAFNEDFADIVHRVHRMMITDHVRLIYLVKWFIDMREAGLMTYPKGGDEPRVMTSPQKFSYVVTQLEKWPNDDEIDMSGCVTDSQGSCKATVTTVLDGEMRNPFKTMSDLTDEQVERIKVSFLEDTPNSIYGASATKTVHPDEDCVLPGCDRYGGNDTYLRIRKVLGHKGAFDFCMGNVIKLVDRWEKKGDPAQNLEKLRDYSAQALVEWRLWNEKLS